MSKPKSLVERLPADFHNRLENWGDVMRVRHQYGVSPTYEVCQRMKREAGEMLPSDEAVVYNEPDAALIEAAWRITAGYRMNPQHVGMLRAYYVLQQPHFIICRLWAMRVREFDDTLVRAVLRFQEIVALYEIRVHNAAHSVLTTV